MLKKISILGVGVTNETEEEILKYLLLSLKNKEEKYFIVTPNPEILVYANNHPHYKNILNEAKIALPDGVGVFLAALLTGRPLSAQITGVDFMEEVCKSSAECPIYMGFLGGRRGVAERAADCLKARYPWIEVGFVGEDPRKLLKSLKSPMDILFVAFGHPKQEEWIYENLERLPVKVAMGVGGAFDYISGEVDRAPFVVRFMGFEWLYRLIREPWRWRRQLALPKFVWLVLRERLSRENE